MNRTRIVFAGLLVAMFALLAAGGYALVRRTAAAREARGQRDAAFTRLVALFQANPFPDAANADRMNSQVQRLGQMRAAMTNTLAQRDVPLPELSPSRFIQDLQTALRDRLQARAPIVEGSRVIPEGFAFGFDRYLGANAPMPAEADVPRLAQQLVMVENLVNEVYASQVSALRGIEREVFEAAAATAPEPEAARPRNRARAGASAFYRSQRFRMVVEGRQSTIGDLLNRFAAMPMFVVVQDVEMRKQGEDLRPPQAAAPGAPVPGAPGASVFGSPEAARSTDSAGEAAAPAEAPVSDLPPSRRLVSGREIDPLIEARIELDVFNFKKEGV
ncbi:MAG: hypothetical protein GX571_12725 [Lentisphaerae bacterium]|jgi:hypothetical protein|nr:hypothetical protein [Lentisphaerota bacterium]